MALRLMNTLGRKMQRFVPLRKRTVRMYTCGPTVWDYAHIGNFRTYVFQDVLRRYLEYKGYRVIQVTNVTDVDDKTIRQSRAAGVTLRDYTKKYEEAYFEDIAALNIEKAEHYPRATEHIDEMVALVKKLVLKGVAYEAEESVYFDVSKFKRYGRLSGARLSELRPGARVDSDEYGKNEARDFVIWKGWRPENGEVCSIYAATANPIQVVVAETGQGRGILGVIDGSKPKGIETVKDVEDRKSLLRKIGYKL